MDNIDLLEDLDLSQFSEAQREIIEANLYGQWEERIGQKVGTLINDQKFVEFEALVSQGNEEKLEPWLDANVPGYEDLAAQLLEELKQEVRTNPESFF